MAAEATSLADPTGTTAPVEEEVVAEETEAETDADTVCGYYFPAQMKIAALQPESIEDTSSVATVGGVALPAPDCAMRITLGNGATQINLGWDSIEHAAIGGPFLSAGYTDGYAGYEKTADEASYNIEGDGVVVASIDAGLSIDPNVRPGSVILSYVP
ncbi:hypothetical protein GCM10010988_03600 [Cnuibacter physcomitrellae]|uniref:Uncharacterized protein n=2 Tax=Cnuibacter physcomitrellae TaxID=1619308 RepID=A0A1X9LLX7_9MICO|nr:hypothetical protein B5808_08725 [Cnuibacter physcomitrellae]GGI35373.1 hypothetical protein GCM10010988_03600 [Cnuibacter physcomitrellae]